MKSVIVIQARTNSSRLPGKVLLPIGGLPIAVLAAKRASNTGRKTIVVTSTESSDDSLVDLLKIHEVLLFRGSLENTLLRYVDALQTYDDETIVFRLTADNVIPDGALLDEIESYFLAHKLEYLACNGENSGVPYGLSVEVTRLAHLREAFQLTQNPHDTEHVTPYIIRKFGSQYFKKYLDKRMGHFRCTIDCLDDYLCIERLFKEVDDPVTADAFYLIDQLKNNNLQPQIKSPAKKLVLGAAQLGLAYGIANTYGQPSRKDGCQLIKRAITNGVQFLDTARSYGDSEEAIGDVLRGGWQNRAKVITKLSPLNDCPSDANVATVNAFVDASLYQSMTALGVQRIDVLLLHRAVHIRGWNANVWRRLLHHRDAGRIQALGVSLQTPDELALALCNQDVTHIQLPFNILDGRWNELASKLQQVKVERSLTVHVRSVLLQGLLNSRNVDLWETAHVANPQVIWQWLDSIRESFKRTSITDLCCGFVAGHSWVDGLVIGVETMDQLSENLSLIGNEPLTSSQIEVILNTRPRLDERSLNPALWKVN